MLPPEEPQSAPDQKAATLHLTRVVRGDTSAHDQLFMMLLTELQTLASRLLQGERRSHTLQSMALVNEAWMRLIRASEVGIEEKSQFMALAATAMRNILVDHARKKQSLKRDGRQVELSEELYVDDGREELDLVALDQALQRLKGRSEQRARLVELRYFAGRSHEEIATILGVSKATVVRNWRVAKSLLKKYMHEAQNPSDPGASWTSSIEP